MDWLNNKQDEFNVYQDDENDKNMKCYLLLYNMKKSNDSIHAQSNIVFFSLYLFPEFHKSLRKPSKSLAC